MRYEPIEITLSTMRELTAGGFGQGGASTRVTRSWRSTSEQTFAARTRSRAPLADHAGPRHGTVARTGDADGLARVTLDAARVSWPVAERRGVALVCSTPDDLVAGALPCGARAAIAAMMAVLINRALPGAVVSCRARMLDGDATISVEASQFGACILNISQELRALSAAPGALPEQAGLRLDLWRAGKLAAIIGAHLSFVPRANGAIAFELRFPIF